MKEDIQLIDEILASNICFSKHWIQVLVYKELDDDNKLTKLKDISFSFKLFSL